MDELCLINNTCFIKDNDGKTTEKIYTPSELNDMLINEMNNIVNNIDNITLRGDLKECKVWKRCGISFKIYNKNHSFECKAWEKDGCKVNQILESENMNCKVKGYLTAEHFYSHKFILNIYSIQTTNEKSNIEKLIDICKKENYFNNKKKIRWENIKNIGIISKKDTQGYNDFIKQFILPINLILEEIALEGTNTCKQAIKAIENLQKTDIIIILRGGGATSEISNSFDKIELFQKIKESKIPIVTAIGHQSDKGDKLLITEISDFDFSTPSTASYEIKKKITELMLTNIIKYKSKIELHIDKFLINKKKRYYDSILKLFNDYKIELFGTNILVKIEDSTDFIIVEKNGKFYKSIINYDNLLPLDNNNVNQLNNIINELNTHKIDKLEEYLKLIKHNNNTNLSKINKYLEKLKIINGIEEKYLINEGILDNNYLKIFELERLKIAELIRLHNNYKFFVNILKDGNKNDINKIYKFCSLNFTNPY